jgi:predicted Rdx family selenoprotein
VLQRAGHEASATAGGKGQFDVLADGGMVFSKADEGRFPEDDEIVTALG